MKARGRERQMTPLTPNNQCALTTTRPKNVFRLHLLPGIWFNAESSTLPGHSVDAQALVELTKVGNMPFKYQMSMSPLFSSLNGKVRES